MHIKLSFCYASASNNGYEGTEVKRKVNYNVVVNPAASRLGTAADYFGSVRKNCFAQSLQNPFVRHFYEPLPLATNVHQKINAFL